jgi:hypothetical protein
MKKIGVFSFLKYSKFCVAEFQLKNEEKLKYYFEFGKE